MATGRVKRPQLPASVERGAREHFTQPLYYDRAYASRVADIAYYVDLARTTRGPVLEYGVGTGRIALPIAELGREVVGVDSSREMLRVLRSKLARRPELAARIALRRGDMRRVRLQRRFPLVIAPFNAVLHLYQRRDVEKFLRLVAEHLTPRGRFVFDVSVPRPRDLGVDPERWVGGPRVRHPELGGQVVAYAERFHYAPITQVLSTWMRFSGARTQSEVLLTQRQFFPSEMEALLHYNGFGNCRFFGGFDGSRPSSASDTLVVMCRYRHRAAAAR